MKIRYRHFSEPDIEKTLDTYNSYFASIGFIHGMGGNPTQEEYDKQMLERLAEDKKNGVILSYEVIDYHTKVRTYRG